MIVMKDEMFILGSKEASFFKLFNRMTIKKLLYKPKYCKQNTTNSHNKKKPSFHKLNTCFQQEECPQPEQDYQDT